jgi:hypothetical protein
MKNIIINTINIDGLNISLKELNNHNLKLGDRVRIEKMTGSKKEYEVFLKLLGLWELLIKEYSDQTGYSKEYCKYDLKRHSGFGIIITDHFEVEVYEEKIFIPRSMAWGESTPLQRSELFTKSILYLKEDEKIDTCEFEKRYHEICESKGKKDRYLI